MSQQTRVCIIGCGPAGMSALYHFAKLPSKERPDIVCFEKQDKWGGQWNPTWRTGIDENGELVHSGIYPNLLTNVPKEVMEYPDFSFQDHFKKPIPSYVDVGTMREYLEARMKTSGLCHLKEFIKYSTVVRKVEYSNNKKTFSVIAHNLLEDHVYEESGFSHLIIATGIFTIPYIPSIPGLDNFKGRILHSRDFRHATDFKDKTILILGSSYSAQDLTQMCHKFGATRIICSWRTSPMGFKWPSGIEERPQVKRFNGNSAMFSDTTSAEVDVVIFCTGYQRCFPFLPDDIRLKEKEQNTLYPNDLYKGVLFMKGGNQRVIYLGTQSQVFSLPMFDVQAAWACRFIMGELKVPEVDTMLQDVEVWKEKHGRIKDVNDFINFQKDYIVDLAKEIGYKNKFEECVGLYQRWCAQKVEDISTFRDKQFTSVYSGVMAALPAKPWMKRF